MMQNSTMWTRSDTNLQPEADGGLFLKSSVLTVNNNDAVNKYCDEKKLFGEAVNPTLFQF